MCELCSRKAQPFEDVEQQPLLFGVQFAIRIGGVELDRQKHLQQGGAPVTLLAQLREHCIEGEIRGLAFIEEIDGKAPLLLIEPHLGHHMASKLDLVPAYVAIGLGHMPHDRKSCGKESGLCAFGLTWRQCFKLLQAAIELMPQGRAQQRAQRPAGHEAKGATDNLAPPTHCKSSLRTASRMIYT